MAKLKYLSSPQLGLRPAESAQRRRLIYEGSRFGRSFPGERIASLTLSGLRCRAIEVQVSVDSKASLLKRYCRVGCFVTTAARTYEVMRSKVR